jgi:hypothetical protein
MKSFGKERISKRAILKDGTSSVTQISMMVLGPKSQDSLNAANLGNSEY